MARDSHREHYAWMEAVLADPDLSTAQKNVALKLGLHKNIKTGQCNPGMKTLAHGAAMTVRGVRKALDRLSEAGWIERTRGGRGPKHTNSYRLRGNGGSSLGFAKGERNDQKGGTAVPPNTEEHIERRAAEMEGKEESKVFATYSPQWNAWLAHHEATGNHERAELMRHNAENGRWNTWQEPMPWPPA